MNVEKFVKLNKDELFVDIGANDGGVMLKVKEEVGCRVIGYEPNPQGELPTGLVVHWSAVGSKKGIADLYRYGMDGQADSLIQRVDGDKPRKFPWKDRYEGVRQVPVKAFSDIVKQHGSVGFCNMDCEGSEFDILLNTDIESLQSCRAYLVEFHINHDFDDGRDYQALTDQCVKRMTDAGFSAVHYGTKNTYYHFVRV